MIYRCIQRLALSALLTNCIVPPTHAQHVSFDNNHASHPESVPPEVSSRVEPRNIVTALEHSLRQRYKKNDPLFRFYEQRAFEPVWFDAGITLKEPTPFITMLASAAGHGLSPEYYRAPLLRKKSSSGDTGQDFELLLTESLLSYLNDVSFGRLIPKEQYIDVTRTHKDDRDPVIILHSLLRSENPATDRRHPAPSDNDYRSMKVGLAFYDAIIGDGGFVHMPSGRSLRPGERDERVPLLRVRLDQEKFFDTTAEIVPDQVDIHDESLVTALKAFQRTRGLKQDGIMGPVTVAALNVSAHHLVNKIRIGLERRRWLPAELEPRRLMVNIPAYKVTAFDNHKKSFDMKVIVGEHEHETPVFSSVVKEIIFHPYWYMPKRLREEVYLPKFISRPDYAVTKGYKIFAPSGRWTPISPYNLTPGVSYRVRQDPGPHNALGSVKFAIENGWSIYMHDTSAPRLFKKEQRALSSGCVRLEDPVKMAQFLLAHQPGYSDEIIANIFSRERTKKSQKRVKLDKPVRIHLLYQTVSVDEDGILYFYDDVYGLDKKLLQQQKQQLRATLRTFDRSKSARLHP